MALAELVVPAWGVCVTVREREMWCRKCGDSGVYTSTTGLVSCGRCGSKKLVRAVDVLRSDEYQVDG